MEYAQDCWCSRPDETALKVRCVTANRCILCQDGKFHERDRATLIGTLTDYFNGMLNREIRKKWSVSSGYIYKKLARINVPHKTAAKKAANQRQVLKRGLIPYAGKEKGQ
jgi:hypothetical protein